MQKIDFQIFGFLRSLSTGHILLIFLDNLKSSVKEAPYPQYESLNNLDSRENF